MKFAFLVHPRSPVVPAKVDMGKVFPLFRLVPDLILIRLMKHLPPILGGRVAYNTNSGQNGRIAGYIIVVPLTADQMVFLPRTFVLNKIIEAIRKAKDLGAEIVGLGERISSISHGGEDLIGKVPGVGITNGNGLTASLTAEAVKKAAGMRKIDLSKIKVGIAGATGSVGAPLSLLLAEQKISLILAARGRARLEKLLSEIKSRFPKAEAEITTDLHDLKAAKVVIVVTAGSGDIIRSEHLAKGALIYDNTQPRNTSPRLLEQRKDVTIIDGGIVATPGVNFGIDIGLKAKQAYACLAETMLIALERNSERNHVGNIKPEVAKEMLSLMHKHSQHFKLAHFQTFGKPIEGEKG